MIVFTLRRWYISKVSPSLSLSLFVAGMLIASPRVVYLSRLRTLGHARLIYALSRQIYRFAAEPNYEEEEEEEEEEEKDSRCTRPLRKQRQHEEKSKSHSVRAGGGRGRGREVTGCLVCAPMLPAFPLTPTWLTGCIAETRVKDARLLSWLA